MKLYNNRPSPYGRKVLIAAHEKSLMKRITLFQIDPWSDPSALLAVTPIGKVPALVADDGAVITDSTIISEYFDAVGHGRVLIGADRFEVMARVALMQGLIDAAFAIVIERRRPTERRWDDWVSRQHRAIARTLEIVAPVDDRFDLGDIALACALAYLDFRLPEIAWRCAHRHSPHGSTRSAAVRRCRRRRLKITERDAHSRLRPAQRHGWRGRGRRFGAR
jgi:glutathione S-transferase